MRVMTAGESHGVGLTALVSGVPAGLELEPARIDEDLQRRQGGYGRSARQDIACDTCSIESGIAGGRTTGAPLCLRIANHPATRPSTAQPQYRPRPGHADLSGALVADDPDIVHVSERASARSTAARVAAGAVAKALLREVGVEIASCVTGIGTAVLPEGTVLDMLAAARSACFCPDEPTTQRMRAQIDAARAAGDSLGGTFTVVAEGLVAGLGSCMDAEQRLNARLGAAIFGIPGIKAVEFGAGVQSACMLGSAYHDPITYCTGEGFTRASNNAGGLEGGMTTGQPLVIKATMKPIPTLANPLSSVDLITHETCDAPAPRADVCAVPACSVVAEAEVALVLADAYLKRFGCTNVGELQASVAAYRRRIATAFEGSAYAG